MSSFESTGEEKGEKKQRLAENEEEENQDDNEEEEEVKGEEEEEEVVYTRHEMNWNDVSSSKDYSNLHSLKLEVSIGTDMSGINSLPDLSPLSHLTHLYISFDVEHRGSGSQLDAINSMVGMRMGDNLNFFMAASLMNSSVRVPTVEIKALRCLDQFTNLKTLKIMLPRHNLTSFFYNFWWSTF